MLEYDIIFMIIYWNFEKYDKMVEILKNKMLYIDLLYEVYWINFI